jgi:hypothetical protein
MKRWMWVSIVAIIVIGLIVLAGKDDIIRIQKMHRM